MNLDIPEPEGLPFEEWVSALEDSVSPIDVAVNAASEAAWQNWAVNLLEIQVFGAAPNPLYYSNWQDWARDLSRAV